jgi:hypothetical protein
MSRLSATAGSRRRSSRLAVIIVPLVIAVGVGTYWLRHRDGLIVTPLTYSECAGPYVVAHIKWDMRGRAAGNEVNISTYKIGLLPTIFAEEPLVGETDTGEWVSDGMTILLTDSQGRTLAKRTVESTDCPTGPTWQQVP